MKFCAESFLSNGDEGKTRRGVFARTRRRVFARTRRGVFARATPLLERAFFVRRGSHWEGEVRAAEAELRLAERSP